jgi:transcriptional regulator with XRE-family HTH domain
MSGGSLADYDPTVSERIRERRLAKDLSQNQLGRLLDTTGMTVSNWERGIAYPSRLHRRQLAKHLGGRPSDYAPE